MDSKALFSNNFFHILKIQTIIRSHSLMPLEPQTWLFDIFDMLFPFLAFLVQSALLGWFWGLPAAKALRQ